jgi:hypothetical protein
MSPVGRLLLATLAAGALAACEAPESVNPTHAPGPRVVRPDLTVSAETQSLEGAARRLAVALADPVFRARFRDRLVRSPYPEQKIHLQRTLQADGAVEARAVARLNREPDQSTDSVYRSVQALEVYLPVPEHRAGWRGDTRLLVATAARDGDLPVAFDLQGGRHLLDPTRPPRTPVLAVVPVETDFDLPPARSTAGGNAVCADPTTCGGNGGGGTPTPGLYMTKAHFQDDFEGWLKGSPEFEIHIMGQKGTTDSLTRLQCSGEHSLGLYQWDGGKDWTGNVLLFSQIQIDGYKAAHPGESFRIVALEDDDTACVLKADSNRWGTFIGSLGPLYQDVTGAVDSGSVNKIIKAARSIRDFLAALGGLIKTNDDLIGNAMEDKVVSEYHTGFNWILKADDNDTNGWINLIMR